MRKINFRSVRSTEREPYMICRAFLGLQSIQHTHTRHNMEASQTTLSSILPFKAHMVLITMETFWDWTKKKAVLPEAFGNFGCLTSWNWKDTYNLDYTFLQRFQCQYVGTFCVIWNPGAWCRYIRHPAAQESHVLSVKSENFWLASWVWHFSPTCHQKLSSVSSSLEGGDRQTAEVLFDFSRTALIDCHS